METENGLEQRGLAGAVAAQQGHDLAGLDRHLADLEHGAHARDSVEAEEARAHPRIGPHLGGTAARNDAAAVEADQAIAGARQELDVVIDDQHAASGLAQLREERSPASALMRRRCRPPARRAAGSRPRRHRARRRRPWVSPASTSAWKLRPMPARATACAGRCSMRRSSSVMAPSSARSRPLMTLSSVVLPEPLGPIRPTISPRSDQQRDTGQRLHAAEAFGDAIDREVLRAGYGQH